MVEVNINANYRPGKTKKYIHNLRNKGKIPAVVYGKGIASEPIEVDARELETALRKKGRNALINLVVQGKQGSNKYVVMVKEIQREALRGNIVHADLCKVSLEDKIHAVVPVVLRGESPGVKQGGIIQAGLREVEIECLPTQIPESISVDISTLNIGDHLTVADLPKSPDYRVLSDEDAVIVTIVAPRMAEQPEATGAEEPAAAPAAGKEPKKDEEEGE